MNDPTQHIKVSMFDPDIDEAYFDGERITTDMIDHMEAQAMEGMKIPRPWLKPGGKSLSGGDKHSPRFQVILGENTAEQVRSAASAEHMSVSRWLRRTVEEKLAA
ncbi:MAG: hypothetical protein FWG15_05930 [Propionibacteriaceae bacterium]|nr:hypothetical protein [Propionibacteriaceae bacterium]